jgi:hypothetical protein
MASGRQGVTAAVALRLVAADVGCGSRGSQGESLAAAAHDPASGVALERTAGGFAEAGT